MRFALQPALPWASWAGTVHHGLPIELHRPHYDAGRHLVFLGRIAPEKGVDRAIARRGLIYKAKYSRSAATTLAAILSGSPAWRATLTVEYLGEIDERAKTELPGGALALLFPIDWPEPFGLTMIEAMACGMSISWWATARST